MRVEASNLFAGDSQSTCAAEKQELSEICQVLPCADRVRCERALDCSWPPLQKCRIRGPSQLRRQPLWLPISGWSSGKALLNTSSASSRSTKASWCMPNSLYVLARLLIALPDSKINYNERRFQQWHLSDFSPKTVGSTGFKCLCNLSVFSCKTIASSYRPSFKYEAARLPIALPEAKRN